MIYMKLTSESGITGEMVMGIYDAEAKVSLTSGLITESSYSTTFIRDGNGMKSGSFDDTNFIEKVAETGERPKPVAVSLQSDSPSIYEEGDYTGILKIYLATEKNPVPSSSNTDPSIYLDSNISTFLDITFSVTGNTISGKGMVQNQPYKQALPSGSIVTLNGTISGSLYFITLEHSESDMTIDLIGSFSTHATPLGNSSTRFYSFYGVAKPYKEYRSGEFSIDAAIIK